MVEKCLEYLKAAEQDFEVKKISLNQQRMMLKDLSYEGLKSLLQRAKCGRARRQGAANTSSSIHRNLSVPRLRVSTRKA